MSTAISSCSQAVPSPSHPQKAVASKLEGIAVHSRCCCRRHKQQDTEQRTTLKSRSSESFGKEVRLHYTRPFATTFLTKIFFSGKWHVKITYQVHVRWAGCPILQSQWHKYCDRSLGAVNFFWRKWSRVLLSPTCIRCLLVQATPSVQFCVLKLM